ncbi:hypothetical protein UA08_02568 [Talaromyces atroroseus]|uniref:Transport and Golgi organization protein 2-like protein n=1 Tax=Talaromyces atroroseus TaxID=1441469 RepID=A0A225AM51_TALAT|nr:hypothetical protein UA08_02568 [Talaromyces atroroseus]OKL61970.1 hypothetical protein UA08_02568 [Talaromyces atroroseus]
MCIAIVSTAHPAYQLIIIDNRDEYLHRPTAPAAWWQEPNSQVLGSRDLARPEQGTWMGVTRQGRVAVLTNYREPAPFSSVSRGVIVNEFLTEAPSARRQSNSSSSSSSIKQDTEEEQQRTTRQFVADMIESQTAKKAGGFSLVCGKIGEPLAIISNRMPDDIDAVTWIAGKRGETVGLSNTVLHDRTWPKIINGEILMRSAIEAHVVSTAGDGYQKDINVDDEEDLISRLFDVLNTDSLPRLQDREPIKEQYMSQLKESIFIPLLGDRAKFEAEVEQLAKLGLQGYMSGLYGTQKQTVLLVDYRGRVRGGG